MKILITGAAGFIGYHLCERLLKDRNIVWGLDNFDPFYDVSIKENNVSNLQRHPEFHLVRGDIRDSITLKRLWDEFEPDHIVHLAACAGVRPSIAQSSLL